MFKREWFLVLFAVFFLLSLIPIINSAGSGTCTCNVNGKITSSHCSNGYYASCDYPPDCVCLACDCSGNSCQDPGNTSLKCDGCHWKDVSSDVEFCNGLDDDCDGTVDEGNLVKGKY